MIHTENVLAELACYCPVAAAAVPVNPKETVDLMPEVVATCPVFHPDTRGWTERIGLRLERFGADDLATNCPFGGLALLVALIGETQFMGYTTYLIFRSSLTFRSSGEWGVQEN